MAEENTQSEQQLVVLDLGSEAYGVDISSVREIIRMQEITQLPRMPEYVEGVINLRGKVTPVVDLRKRFRIEVTEYTKETRIVVVDVGNQDIGVIVDAVTEVLRISSGDIEPPSTVVTTEESDYLMGIVKLSERLIILLDLDRVLADQANIAADNDASGVAA